MVEKHVSALGQVIDAALKRLGKNQSWLAEEVGVSDNAISKWKRTGQISRENAVAVADLLALDLDVLLARRADTVEEDRSEYSAEHPGVPVVGTAQLGDNGYWHELDYPVGQGEGFITYPTRDKNAYALRVKGDSMRPRIKPGEFVVILPNHSIPPGEEVMVKTIDGRCMIKRLGSRRGGLIELISINETDHRPITLDESQVEKLHYVAAIVKDDLYRSTF